MHACKKVKIHQGNSLHACSMLYVRQNLFASCCHTTNRDHCITCCTIILMDWYSAIWYFTKYTCNCCNSICLSISSFHLVTVWQSHVLSTWCIMKWSRLFVQPTKDQTAKVYVAYLSPGVSQESLPATS